MAVLRGNLAPGGAVIKHFAASPRLLAHTGRAMVFDSLGDLAVRIDDPDLAVAPGDVLVLCGAGPKGAPGMPEAGYIPIPKKLASRGVRDMVRLSDARMSGTAFGTIVLHVTPESAIGGPLVLVETGDRIRLDVGARLPPTLPRHRDRSRSRLGLRIHGPSRRFRPSGTGSMIRRSDSDPVSRPSAQAATMRRRTDSTARGRCR